MCLTGESVYGYVNDVPVYQYTLQNGLMKASVITYGATLTELWVPDAEGNARNVVLGYPSMDAYLSGTGYYGAVLGRYGNRIEKGQFSLDGKTYKVGCNEGENSLHGGHKGFDKQIWQVQSWEGDAITLSYCSSDGEEGFPGNLTVQVRYALTQEQGISIAYTAVSDAKTVVNLTNHSYFNLNGTKNGQEDVELWIDADSITPVDEQLIPHNTYRSVDGTLFDFRSPKGCLQDWSQEPALMQTGCYDHNFVLNGAGMRTVARVTSGKSGISMDVITDQPGMQIYTGNPGGIALETQNFPNAVNCPNYPSAVLEQGAQYKTTTVYRFSTHR